MSENTTTNRKLPYPSSTGLVKLGAEDFKELAEALDVMPWVKTKNNTTLTTVTAEYDEFIQTSTAAESEIKLPTSVGAGKGRIIGVLNYGAGRAQVKATGGFYGLGRSGTTNVELKKGQSLFAMGTGVGEPGSWVLLNAPPALGGALTTLTERLASSGDLLCEYTTLVSLAISMPPSNWIAVKLNGTNITEVTNEAFTEHSWTFPYSFICPARSSWSWSFVSGSTAKVKYSHLTLEGL